MIRKLLLAITCITLCSCGTSHRPLENTQSDKLSLREYILMRDSIRSEFENRAGLIAIAREDSIMESPKKLKRDIHKAFDEIFEQEFSAEIDDWAQRPPRSRWRPFRTVTIFYESKGVYDAYIYSMSKAIREAEANADKNKIKAEVKYFRKRWRKGELKSNIEFSKGFVFGDSLRVTLNKLTFYSRSKTRDLLKKYFDFKLKHPLSEQSDMFLYGYMTARPFHPSFF